jgi:hypothetical protein
MAPTAIKIMKTLLSPIIRLPSVNTKKVLFPKTVLSSYTTLGGTMS